MVHQIMPKANSCGKQNYIIMTVIIFSSKVYAHQLKVKFPQKKKLGGFHFSIWPFILFTFHLLYTSNHFLSYLNFHAFR